MSQRSPSPAHCLCGTLHLPPPHRPGPKLQRKVSNRFELEAEHESLGLPGPPTTVSASPCLFLSLHFTEGSVASAPPTPAGGWGE